MPTNKTKDKMESTTCPCCCGPGFIIVRIIALLILPIAFIWSLNTLFFAGTIGYSIYDWFAALIIIFVVSGGKVMMRRWHFGNGCGCGGQCACSMDQKK